MASVQAALEWGLFPWAKEILDNYLTYYVRENGAIFYRGLEMPQQGRMLTLISMYHRYTGDARLLAHHLPKIQGVVQMLNDRRERSLKSQANPSQYGMPTGNDEADLWQSTVSGRPNSAKTEMPFVSIAAEMWRGYRDCGASLIEVANSLSQEQHDLKRRMIALGEGMNATSLKLMSDLKQSMALDRFPDGNGTYCHPYVSGVKECGFLPNASYPSHRASEPWRTYSELLYSGAVDAASTAEILSWMQVQQGSP